MSDNAKFVVFAGIIAAVIIAVIVIRLLCKRYIYDSDGYNGYGFDREGYDRQGYDRSGFNRKGIDRYHYNRKGKDKSGRTREDYRKVCEEMQSCLKDARKQLKKKKFAFSLQAVRVGLEKGTKIVIFHRSGLKDIAGLEVGGEKKKSDLDTWITACKNKNYLKKNFTDKLYRAKNHCNDLMHDSNKSKSPEEVEFCCDALETLIEQAAEITNVELK